jgi:hypothetical protein
LRNGSVKNQNSNAAMLGKYDNGGPTGYTSQAGKEYKYFDMGNNWGKLQQQYGYTDKEMFDMFNIPFLDDVIANKQPVHFSHDPTTGESALKNELNYLLQQGYNYDPLKMVALPK